MKRIGLPQALGRNPAFTIQVIYGALAGIALGVLAAFVGEVRTTLSVLVGLVVFGAVCGLARWSFRALLLGAGVLTVLLGVCLLTPVLRGPLQGLTVREVPVRADAIVVLGGGVGCGSGTLESSSLTRLVRGLELWRAGFAGVVTVSEQSGVLGPRDCPKMSVLESGVVGRLYPQGGPTVLTLRSVTTTRDEVARVRELARQLGWRRVLVVTTPSHSRRALGLFRAQGVEAVSVPAAETRFDETLPLPVDRLWAVRVLSYEGLSRLKALVGGSGD